jgi:flagellar biosynthesis anti-sigma factor FlgM
MKITPKTPGDAELSQAVQKDKKVGVTRRESDSTAQRSGASTSVNISTAARKLQRVAELAQKGDDLRAEKVKALKEKIASGQYDVGAEDVAKSIIRNNVARLLEKKK